MRLPPVARAVVYIRIPTARSLKDKRSVVQSVIGQARSRFAVAIAETNAQDHHTLAELGIAVVSGQESTARQVLDDVLRFVEAAAERHGAQVTGFEVEVI
ncbi:MAG TPA: DUF503 domain-containing protein [Firmicutes bacterium]|nr:DUF503 domain-containing protein [Bacillota bacterium]